MPIQEKGKKNTVAKLAEQQLLSIIEKYVDGLVDVDISEHSAIVYVESRNIPYIIGKGGKTISKIESEAGLKLHVRPHSDGEIIPSILKRKKDLVLRCGKDYAGREVQVSADGVIVFSGNVSQQGEIKLHRNSGQGRSIVEAIASNKKVTIKIM